MLEHTFVHIAGIGPKTERQLWDHGIFRPADLVEPYPATLPSEKIRIIERYKQQNDRGHNSFDYFASLLKIPHHWRLFSGLRQRAVYLDIETTGLSREESIITTIALYDGSAIHTYVHGENMEQFKDDIDRYDLIVTFNGKRFDLPMLERHLGISFRQVHIDLRFVLQSIGIAGGLKRCEKKLGISRGALDGLDGYGAVLLWREYERTGDRRALETLLAYNVEDTVNLEQLMVHAYNLHLASTPFVETHGLEAPTPPVNPYMADAELVDRIRLMQGGGWGRGS